MSNNVKYSIYFLTHCLLLTNPRLKNFKIFFWIWIILDVNTFDVQREEISNVIIFVVENRKAPPLPPERRDSRLTSTDANSISRQRSASLANQPTAVQSLG